MELENLTVMLRSGSLYFSSKVTITRMFIPIDDMQNLSVGWLKKSFMWDNVLGILSCLGHSIDIRPSDARLEDVRSGLLEMAHVIKELPAV